MASQSHHYVPRMYLSGFFDPKQVARKQNVLWRYRPGGRPEMKGVKKVAEQINFYDLPEVEEQDNDIERMLSQIETDVVWHLKKLRSGRIRLNVQEKAELASYFALQYTRTPWFRELTNKSVISLQLAGLKDMLDRPGEVDKFLEEMRRESGEEIKDVESLKKYMTRVVEGEVPMVQRNKAWNAKVMLEHADRLGERFFHTRWNLLEARPDFAFITSDNPLHIVDPAAAKLSPDGFKFSKEMEFYIPLSPRFMLVGDLRDEADRRVLVTPDSVQRANAIHMARAQELYASFFSKELQAEFTETAKTRPPSIRELPHEYLKATIERARRKG